MEEKGNAVRKTRPVPARPLRVLLDARKLEDGGIGTYIRNLIRGLSGLEEVSLTVLCDPERAGRAGFAPDVEVIAEAARPYSFDEFVRMPGRIRFEDFDVFHMPHYTLPFGVPIPTVITVHDLIHVYAPEHFYYPVLSRPLIRSALRRADRVVTVSYSSYQQIRKFVRQDPSIIRKMHVIPNAIDSDLLPQSDVQKAGSNGRPRDYFLAVFSNTKPHKGLEDLLSAYRELRKESMSGSGPEVLKRLVLVGPGTEGIKGRSFGVEPGMPGEILALGEVTREALRRLYLHAAALIVPSTAEGFCLPVLEAHAAGIPVITRPVPAVLELSTAFDVMCADFSLTALKEGIRKFLSSPELSVRRIQDLQNQVEQFTVEGAAKAVHDVYAEAVHSQDGGVS